MIVYSLVGQAMTIGTGLYYLLRLLSWAMSLIGLLSWVVTLDWLLKLVSNLF